MPEKSPRYVRPRAYSVVPLLLGGCVNFALACLVAVFGNSEVAFGCPPDASNPGVSEAVEAAAVGATALVELRAAVSTWLQTAGVSED